MVRVRFFATSYQFLNILSRRPTHEILAAHVMYPRSGCDATLHLVDFGPLSIHKWFLAFHLLQQNANYILNILYFELGYHGKARSVIGKESSKVWLLILVYLSHTLSTHILLLAAFVCSSILEYNQVHAGSQQRHNPFSFGQIFI